MRPWVLAAITLQAPWVAGCAMTWGLADPETPPEATPAVAGPRDPELERLARLAEKLDQALAEVRAEIARAQARWAVSDAEAARADLQDRQGLLERRLVLSVAIANVEAARRLRLDASRELPGSEPPAREPLPDSLQAVVRQAAEQLRAARDRRDASAVSFPMRPGLGLPEEPRPPDRSSGVERPPSRGDEPASSGRRP